MFLSIYYQSLRTSEFIQFIQNLIEILEAKNPDDLNVRSRIDELKNLLASLTSVFKPNLGSEITSELELLDAARDKAFVGIEQTIKGFTYHFDEATRQAAQILSDSIAVYGTGISRLNYQAETSTINSIINKWQSDAVCADAVGKLALTDWVAHLKSVNDQFNLRSLDRIKEQAELPEVKLADLRKDTIASYRKLLAHLEAYATISGREVYTEVANQVNLLIEQFNRLIVARSSKNVEEEIPTQE